jgi:hypothetical protein
MCCQSPFLSDPLLFWTSSFATAFDRTPAPVTSTWLQGPRVTFTGKTSGKMEYHASDVTIGQ